MAFLLLILLASVLVFLLYYELLWKRIEKERGRSLVHITRDFFFRDNLGPVTAASSWNDWKYRLTAELHRREQLNCEEAARLVGVTSLEVEQYFDRLEAEGKVQQVGDAGRGVSYRVVNV